jgi:hypothetical protein
MSQAGYTLAETLAALLIIGLAFGGLTEGMRVIGMVQSGAARTTSDATRRWAAQDALIRLLDQKGPFRSDDAKRFVGDRSGFSFDCGQSQPCGARIATSGGETRLTVADAGGETSVVSLAPVSSARFAYDDKKALAETWPPAPGERRLLRSVILVGQSPFGEVPLVTARLWREQEVGCQFDPIAQDCRSAAP